MPTVYFDVGWEMDNEEWLRDVEDQSPGSSRRWDDVEAVTDPDEADYHAVFNRPSVTDDPDRRLMFCMEPPCVPNCAGWGRFEALATYPLSRHHKPQNWWIDRSYDELLEMEPPEKTATCSWIISAKGRDVSPWLRPIREAILRTGVTKFERRGIDRLDLPTDGHILRMRFLERAAREEPDLVDLYSTDDFDNPWYAGDVGYRKWEALRDYRYSLAITSCKTRNFWTEKTADALLSWCLPIHWGCTNLDDYLPEDSYVWLDIEDPDAPQRLREILEEDPWEDRLDAIAEARRRILDDYQVWPTVARAIEREA